MGTQALNQVDLGHRIQAELDGFLAAKDAELSSIDQGLGPVADAVREFLRGGKRVRPAFCYWGWRGAGGADLPGIMTAAASLELLQAAALIHDDYMDASDTRRGRPTVHRAFAALHDRHGWQGSPYAFGGAAAIVVGDLCLSWSDEMFDSCGLASLDRAKPVFHMMRTELMAGQYLDVLAQVTGTADAGRALRVIRYKSAKYTIERPLQIGGLLADAADAVLDAYSAYGLPIGEAFQLRDDVLGVFGDPAETGKPAGDDLREGKQTLLVALAHERGDSDDRATLAELLGEATLDERGVAALREVLVRTGALAEVERRINRLTGEALAVLDASPIESVARAALHDLAIAVTARTR